MIKPIETWYQGRRFRSRLEARWAVFFDSLGTRWEYEPEGYVTEHGPYAPDFWLPDIGDNGTWFEVKPEHWDFRKHVRDALERVLTVEWPESVRRGLERQSIDA